MSARLVIYLDDGGSWLVDMTDERLEQIGGLPSGRNYRLERRIGDVQTQDIFIRPYYRRAAGDTITIFAVQTIPEGV